MHKYKAKHIFPISNAVSGFKTSVNKQASVEAVVMNAPMVHLMMDSASTSYGQAIAGGFPLQVRGPSLLSPGTVCVLVMETLAWSLSPESRRRRETTGSQTILLFVNFQE